MVSTDEARDLNIRMPSGLVIREALPDMTTAVYDMVSGKRLDTDELE